VHTYTDAIGALHTAYPDDVEAQAFYGLALAAWCPPGRCTYRSTSRETRRWVLFHDGAFLNLIRDGYQWIREGGHPEAKAAPLPTF
jgi:hypothetical protein